MIRAFGKLATALVLLALPLTATGCRSGMTGWGWSPPSMPSLSSLNPWKSSTPNSQLASSKPSQIPTPPPQLAAGTGLARGAGGNQPSGSNSYGNYGGRSTGSYNPNDYGTRQVSATQGEGYDTGRYSTGGATQNGPYNSGGAGNYGGTADRRTDPAYTADRRSDSAYGAGNGASSGWQGGYGTQNTQPQNARPSYDNNQGAPNGQYQGAAGGQSYPSTGASPYSGASTQSPYAGSTGVSSGSSRSTPAANYGADAYRPGSTARASDIQRASFENGNSPAGGSEGNYPTTPAGDDSAYQ